MIKVTAQQRANAIEARDVMWPSVPESNVTSGLSLWRDDYRPMEPPTCGTVACFGGWCEWYPPFRMQLSVSSPKVASWDAIVGLYGPSDDPNIDGLLDPRGSHCADQGFRGSDHALVLRRINWLIKNSKVDA
jgi:hypothetical protein